MIEREWFTCAESGEKFQIPNGAKCVTCGNMVSTKYYIYVDMEPVCLKCRKAEIARVLDGLKKSLK